LGLILVLVLPAVLLYPRLDFHLLEPDESRYAEIPREMLWRGDWIVPHLNGEPYLDKPPLLYWLVGGSYQAFGLHVWAARLVPVLAVHGSILLVYFFGRRWLGGRAALYGALVLTLAPGFVSMGRLLLIDGLLAFWMTLGLFAGFETLRGERLRWGWWLTAAAACGLGILTKGPVALLLLVPPLWLQRRLAGCTLTLRPGAITAFLAIALGIALPWYVAVCLRTPDFVRHFIWEHNLMRFLAPFDHQRGVWFYGPVLLLGLLPATLLLVPFVRFLLTGDETTAGRRTPELGFLLLAGGWCVLFFTLSGCKLPTYVLPAFPPLALALGYFLAQSRWNRSRVPAIVATGAFIILALGHHVALPWYAAYRSPMGRPEEVVRFCTDPTVPVVCYPRPCDSVAFYLRRDDLRNYRSKDIEDLRDLVRRHPRIVILCTHRHSLRGLRQLLPPEVSVVDETHLGLSDIPGVPPRFMKVLARLMGETALGLCDVAVVEPRPNGKEAASPRQPTFQLAGIEEDEGT
jgi:4-amino-4-deoxy-L-arabinose transferase-like glycosyltransferase